MLMDHGVSWHSKSFECLKGTPSGPAFHHLLSKMLDIETSSWAEPWGYPLCPALDHHGSLWINLQWVYHLWWIQKSNRRDSSMRALKKCRHSASLPTCPTGVSCQAHMLLAPHVCFSRPAQLWGWIPRSVCRQRLWSLARLPGVGWNYPAMCALTCDHFSTYNISCEFLWFLLETMLSSIFRGCAMAVFFAGETLSPASRCTRAADVAPHSEGSLQGTALVATAATCPLWKMFYEFLNRSAHWTKKIKELRMGILSIHMTHTMFMHVILHVRDSIHR